MIPMLMNNAADLTILIEPILYLLQKYDALAPGIQNSLAVCYARSGCCDLGLYEQSWWPSV